MEYSVAALSPTRGRPLVQWGELQHMGDELRSWTIFELSIF